MPYRDCVAAGHRKYQRDRQWFCRDCMVLERQGQQEPPSLPWPEPVPERRVPEGVDPEVPTPPEA